MARTRKKLLIVTGIYPPDIGGPATYVSKIKDDLKVITNSEEIQFEILPEDKEMECEVVVEL